MDATAKEDCERFVDLLRAQAISAVLLDDENPGVVQGTLEVRVPAADVRRAEKFIADHPLQDEAEEVDPSSRLDLETVFHAEGGGNLAEMQAMGVKNLLESNGITGIVFGDSVLPNMPFEVKVAHHQAGQARRLIEEAESPGPIPADETV